jgi:RimJ/RimL family protein N-acetyltransferase
MEPNAAYYSAIEALGDGRRLTVRALRPEDRDDYLAAVDRVSSQSLYRRFFAAKRHFTEKERSFFLDIDFIKHVALVAVIEDNGKPTIAGGARYVVENPRQAEVAFTVVDRYQGLGIGSVLMRHVITIARNAGLDELLAHVLPANTPMLKIFERAGVRISTKRESDSINVTLYLHPQIAPAEKPLNHGVN